jgi:hypothetical protein
LFEFNYEKSLTTIVKQFYKFFWSNGSVTNFIFNLLV